MRYLKYYLILLFITLVSINLGNVFAETYVIGSSETNWVRYEKKADGFAISLPPSWAEFNMDKKMLKETLKKFKENNPNTYDSFEPVFKKLVNGGYIKFYAYDGNSLASGFLTNLNIVKEELGFEILLDVYVELSKAQLNRMDSVVQPINSRRLTTRAGEVEVLQYKINSSGQSIAITQFIAVKGKQAFIISLTAGDGQNNIYGPTFEKIGQSFEILD